MYVLVLQPLLTSNWPNDEKASLWRQTKPMFLDTYISYMTLDMNGSSSVVSVSVWLGHDQVWSPLKNCREPKPSIIRRNIPCLYKNYTFYCEMIKSISSCDTREKVWLHYSTIDVWTPPELHMLTSFRNCNYDFFLFCTDITFTHATLFPSVNSVPNISFPSTSLYWIVKMKQRQGVILC